MRKGYVVSVIVIIALIGLTGFGIVQGLLSMARPLDLGPGIEVRVPVETTASPETSLTPQSVPILPSRIPGDNND